ncbi:MAG TPA: hypothetical protein PK636_03585 [bacterium]|nr:hypothetical protein [bacterium]HPJ71747.1 hypothetical protein [bacterium]HPQ66214.1 hypothetical protein [bacterium]
MRTIELKAGTILALVPLLLASCGGSGSGGSSDGYVKYKAETADPETGCQMRIKYNDSDGDERTRYADAPGPWDYSFYGKDGDHLYLEVKSNDCQGQVTASLYLDGTRLKRITRFTAEIDGYLRQNEDGEFYFEDQSP